jgi:hypothetical protein
MSLEDSMNNLAKAMDKYAEAITAALNTDPKKFVIVNISQASGDAAGSAAAPAADAAPAGKGKGGRKPKETPAADAGAAAGEADPFADGAAAADEADPFGDGAAAEPETPKLTADTIRALVLKVKTEKGAEIAKKLLTHVGVDTLAKIPEKDYQKVVDLAAKVGVTL